LTVFEHAETSAQIRRFLARAQRVLVTYRDKTAATMRRGWLV